MKRGQIQLRGNISWKMRRTKTFLRYGYRNVSRLPIIFGNAIPKCGSKLLFNVLRGMAELGPFLDTGLNEIKPYFQGEATSQTWINSQLDALRGGDIRFGYLYACDENVKRLSNETWASFLIIRDPRDQIVSSIFYAMDIHKDHALHAFLHSQKTMEDRISALIHGIVDGVNSRGSTIENYERFMPWLSTDEICVIRYEDLIADPGFELCRILRHLSDRRFIPTLPHEEAIETLEKQMTPSKSETFRKGQSGGWRQHFTQKNITEFTDLSGDLLSRLGYESD